MKKLKIKSSHNDLQRQERIREVINMSKKKKTAITVMVYSQNGHPLKTYDNIERFYFDKNQTIIVDKNGSEYIITGAITIVEDKGDE